MSLGNLESKTGFRDSETHQLLGKSPPRKVSFSSRPKGCCAGLHSLHLMSTVWLCLYFPEYLCSRVRKQFQIRIWPQRATLNYCPSYFTHPTPQLPEIRNNRMSSLDKQPFLCCRIQATIQLRVRVRDWNLRFFVICRKPLHCVSNSFPSPPLIL